MNEPAAQARVRLCGRLEARFDGEAEPREIPAGQCQALFAYLVLNRERVVTRDELVAALWPDHLPRDPQAVLSTLLSRVRSAVHPAVIDGRSQLTIVLPDAAEIDVERAAAAVGEARAALARSQPEQAARRAREALSLLEGELLPGHEGPWLEEVREAARETSSNALECLAESGLGDAEQAARALVARAPFRESGHLLLMQLLTREGNDAEALLVYDQLRNLLREELGVAPSRDLQDLHLELLGRADRPEPDGPPTPDNLPAELTSFIGRDAEAARVVGELLDGRTATIVGPGGMGKTRLSIRAAGELRSAAPDGVWFVDLAALSAPDLVCQAVADAAGVRVDAGDDQPAELARALGDRQTCIVLDNCEHLGEAAAAVAHAVLGACPDVQVLATSRQPLGFTGERVVQLGPLEEATELFAERARASAADFELSGRNKEAVARLAQRLDGMPLALELAAALVSRLDVHEIDSRLDDRLRLSMGNRSGAPARHATLNAVVAWSHDLLDASERTLFRRLSVFRGGFSLGAAQEVCAGEDTDVTDALLPLVDKSLVIKEERAGRARYRMLETIRQFAAEQLADADEQRAVEERHRGYFTRAAEDAEARLTYGSQQVELLDDLEADLGNFRAALASADGEAALRLAGALFYLWYVRGHLSEGRRWLRLALAAEGEASAVRAKALITAGELAREQGDYRAAWELLDEGRSLAEKCPDATGYGGAPFALFNLGLTAQEQGDRERALPLLQKSYEALCDDDTGVFSSAWPLLRLGELALDDGDAPEARRLVEQSLAGHRGRADREGIARALDVLAEVTRHDGDADAAAMLAEQSLTTAHDLGYQEGVPGPLRTLARIAAARGDHEQAARLCRQSLRVSTELDSMRGVAAGLECAAECSAAAGDHVRALQLGGAAESMRRDMGSPIPAHLAAGYEQALAAARDGLASSRASAAWASGCAMAATEAAALMAA